MGNALPKRAKKRRLQPETILEIILFGAVVVALLWLQWRAHGYKKDAAVYEGLQKTVVTTDGGAQDSGERPLLTVDFDALRERCPDAVAWIELEDMDISYPVMHTDNNEFYLKHAADGTAGISGSIFMDSANKTPDEPHVLLYGHNMQDGSMFGDLLKYRDEAFYHNGTGSFVLYTPEHTWRYRIFSVQITDGNNECYTVGFSHDATFGAFLKQLTDNAMYQTGVNVSSDEKVITLSTCADASGETRMIVSAKRIAVLR